MNNLPILQELFESDGVVLFVFGVIVSLLIGIGLKEMKKCRMGMLISFGIYAMCEIITHFQINYLVAFIVLFVGWIALGNFLGFAIHCIIKFFGKLRTKETT